MSISISGPVKRQLLTLYFASLPCYSIGYRDFLPCLQPHVLFFLRCLSNAIHLSSASIHPREKKKDEQLGRNPSSSVISQITRRIRRYTQHNCYIHFGKPPSNIEGFDENEFLTSFTEEFWAAVQNACWIVCHSIRR